MYKRIVSLIISCVMLVIALASNVQATSEMKLTYELTSDGKNKITVQRGDLIDVIFSIVRTDSDSKYLFNVFQNEIIYDHEFFEYVNDSATLCDGISGNVGHYIRTTGVRIIKAGCLSNNSIDNIYSKNTQFCTFKLRVRDTATGTGIIQSDEAEFYDKDVKSVEINTPILEVVLEGEGTVAVSGIELENDSITLTTIGSTQKIQATVLPENATNKGVKYTSDNNSVATVSADGTVRATGAGSAKITVETLDGGFSAYCNVKVSSSSGTAVTPQINPNEDKEDDKPLRPATIPEALTDKHIAYIVGREEGKVQPQASITRAEVATIFFRLLKDDVREANYTEENTFTDVNDGDWYNTAISTLAKMKIINGRSETEFAPNAFITRAEYATIAARLATAIGEEKVDFSDIGDHWAYESILEAASLGWLKGYEDGTFRPANNITRAEAMTLTNRVIGRQPENVSDILSENMTKFTDNADETAWYYLAIQEATNSHEYEIKDDGIHEKWTKLAETPDFSKLEK